MQRLSLILSTLALVVALTGVGLVQAGVIVTSKQIKNGTIVSADIHKAGVKSTDVANGTIGSADIGNGDVGGVDIGEGQVGAGDIGANQVTPTDVEFPPAAIATPDTINGPVTVGTFAKLGTLDTLQKVQAESSLEVTLAGVVSNGQNTGGCVFQLRVNGAPPVAGGGEAFASSQPVNVGPTTAFEGVAAGSVEIEVWAKAGDFVPGPGVTQASCIVGPGNPGIDTTVLAIEQVV